MRHIYTALHDDGSGALALLLYLAQPAAVVVGGGETGETS
jgi:hypothetical protein